MTKIEDILHETCARREFLQRMAATGIGALSLPLLSGCDTNRASSNGYSNAAFVNIPGRNATEVVLNYALAIKIAQTDLYRQALNRASGRTLSTALDGRLPAANTTGSYTLTLGTGALDSATAKTAFTYLTQFTYVEATHRDYLTALLTGLNAPLQQANGRGYQFPTNEPGGDLNAIVTNLLTLEETSVRGLLGGLPTLANISDAQIVSSLYSVDCRQSATLAALLGTDIGPVPNRGLSADISVTGAAYPHANTFEYASQPNDVLTHLTSAYYVTK